MENKLQKLLLEFIWLILLLVVTILFALFLFGQSFLSSEIDLHLHDTYLVMSNWLVLTTLFLFVTFFVYLIKTRFIKFKSKFSDWVIMISGVTLTLSLTIFIRTITQFSTIGWTLYPPLSALGPDKIPELKPDPLSTFLANFLTLLQIIIVIVTLIKAYKFGTRRKTHNAQ